MAGSLKNRQVQMINQRRKLSLSENKKLRIDPLWFGNFEEAEYPVQYSQSQIQTRTFSMKFNKNSTLA